MYLERPGTILKERAPREQDTCWHPKMAGQRKGVLTRDIIEGTNQVSAKSTQSSIGLQGLLDLSRQNQPQLSRFTARDKAKSITVKELRQARQKLLCPEA